MCLNTNYFLSYCCEFIAIGRVHHPRVHKLPAHACCGACATLASLFLFQFYFILTDLIPIICCRPLLVLLLIVQISRSEKYALNQLLPEIRILLLDWGSYAVYIKPPSILKQTQPTFSLLFRCNHLLAWRSSILILKSNFYFIHSGRPFFICAGDQFSRLR